MSIGYACLTIGVLSTNFKSCILKNVTEEKLLELISHNLKSLENIIDYNIENNIMLFRITSDLIPFGSNPVNNIKWWDVFSSELLKISEKIKSSGMRVSMHPGQYTVINSPSNDVVKRSMNDLNYHARVLDRLGVSKKHKMILHIGGIYNDKGEAVDRFIRNYQYLDESVKNRLVIENDDKLYNIIDVLEIGTKLNIPVIFDNLHNDINFSGEQKSTIEWVNECKKTWKEDDGNQKIHYSEQNPLKKIGSHSNTIDINKFMYFFKELNRNDIDIMLEVKDKNLSAVKCINCISNNNINVLEEEWSRYKYKVLENSPSNYSEIREILKDKSSYPAIKFYDLVDDALQKEVSVENSINVATHIWNCLKDIATEKERASFLKIIDDYKNGKVSINKIKSALFRLSVKYNEECLLHSYYFVL
ncbi:MULTISPECIES: UV DNA damage repair endonuclease UvsE [Clostridium]|uniref:UV DNA damage repair endonuclease UvsE n=1 Tax=Clostridium cibarium TaxID=2762247 RepID=A0ABR8PR05_9CLOT|nr:MULTISPECIES: UV DNA damage repair endonuclease UvsE [Clostridium]MBD7910592.1 UV DNA damage repair endonuclease UvsE [Clostridium cibarium]